MSCCSHYVSWKYILESLSSSKVLPEHTEFVAVKTPKVEKQNTSVDLCQVSRIDVTVISLTKAKTVSFIVGESPTFPCNRHWIKRQAKEGFAYW